MTVEFVRLFLGLLLVAFHQRVADFVLRHDTELHAMFTSRGLDLPGPLTRDNSRTLYFLLGLGVCGLQLTRIYLSL